MHVKKIFLILSLIVLSPNLFAANDFKADDIIGFWLSEAKTGVIEIYKNGKEYEGKLVWIKDIHTGKVAEKFDDNNPDDKLKKRSLQGLKNLGGFKFEGDEWTGGTIYDPKSGKTYSAYMELEEMKSLKLRGYVGISLFGRTSMWSRQKAATPDEYTAK